MQLGVAAVEVFGKCYFVLCSLSFLLRSWLARVSLAFEDTVLYISAVFEDVCNELECTIYVHASETASRVCKSLISMETVLWCASGGAKAS